MWMQLTKADQLKDVMIARVAAITFISILVLYGTNSLFSSFYLCLIFPFVGYCLAAYFHQRQIDTKIVTFVKQFCFGREQQQEDNVVESIPLKLDLTAIRNSLDDLADNLIRKYLLDADAVSGQKGVFKEDSEFITEIRQIIRDSLDRALSGIDNFDIQEIITAELLPLSLLHFDRILSSGLREPNGAIHKNVDPIQLQRSEELLLEIWGQRGDLHWAIRTAANEEIYLRNIADIIVRSLVDGYRVGGKAYDCEAPYAYTHKTSQTFLDDKDPWPSHCCRHFLRELVLSTVLRPALCLASDPDSLNLFILTLFYPSPANSPIKNTCNATESAEASYTRRRSNDIENEVHCESESEKSTRWKNTKNTLLTLTPTDVIKDKRLAQIFRQFLRDSNANEEVFDCFLQARDLLMQIQASNINAKVDPKMTKPRKQQKKRPISEVQADLWLFYSTFVHSNTPNRIRFSTKVLEEFPQIFAHAEQNKSGCGEQTSDEQKRRLEQTLEMVYNEVYQQLQTDCIVSFRESESYFAYLCGPPPDVVELIRRDESPNSNSEERTRDLMIAGENPTGKQSKMLGNVLSLTQFKKKFFGLIGATGGGKDAMRFSRTTSDSFLLNSSKSAAELRPSRNRNQSQALLREEKNIELVGFQKDLSNVHAQIRSIESRADGNSGAQFYVFSIIVEERGHLPRVSTSPSTTENIESTPATELLTVGKWIVERRCDDFYQLAERLQDLQGTALSELPDRSTALYAKNNRMFMEINCVCFERYLKALLEQPLLKRSDLLNTFLTTDQNFVEMVGGSNIDDDELESSSAFSLRAGLSAAVDLNPFRAVRRLPTRMATLSRLQMSTTALKPFIANMIADVLATRSNSPPTKVGDDGLGNEAETTGASTFSAANKPLNRNQTTKNESINERAEHIEKIPVNHCANETEASKCLIKSFGYFGMALFALFRLLSLPAWIGALFTLPRVFFAGLIDSLLQRWLKRLITNQVLTTENILLAIDALKDSLFTNENHPQSSVIIGCADSTNNDSPSTEREKFLRHQLLLCRIEKSLQDIFTSSSSFSSPSSMNTSLVLKLVRFIPKFLFDPEQCVIAPCRALFACTQMPRLNRQLLFVLIDAVLSALAQQQLKRNQQSSSDENNA